MALLFLATVTVGSQPADLRSECDSSAAREATLPAGHPVEIRFALAGEGCYKVSATVDGRAITGYVRASDLTGLDEFDAARKSAGAVQGGSAPAAADPPALNWRSQDPRVAEAAKLIQANQPGRAYDLLSAAVREHPRNLDLLTLAGFAAWRNDDLKTALEHWKIALAIAPNPDLEALCAKVEREAGADQSGERLVGLRVLLRYDPETVPIESARSMLGALDQETSRISAQLGCSGQERLVAIVQSRGAYLQTTGAAEWSAAQYDGRIHVGAPEPGMSAEQLRESFAHEIVHACLANIGSYPAWLHEGLAQRLSGRAMAGGRDAAVAQAKQAGLGKLESLPSSWNSLGAIQARAAYALALAAADALFEHYHEYGLHNLLVNSNALAQATANIDKLLGL